MGFLLRAGLVIGLLAYASAPVTSPSGRSEPGLAEQAASTLPAILGTLPPGLRERAAREGETAAARAIAAQLRGSVHAQVETGSEASTARIR
ncbi:hypothetical protein [Methylobacterium sp. ID0610]|uniref:hypothetical protein n=1 Tax=Methylobacterium carpenticola TaxID=3344827 RepID=UPI003676DD9D